MAYISQVYIHIHTHTPYKHTHTYAYIAKSLVLGIPDYVLSQVSLELW